MAPLFTFMPGLIFVLTLGLTRGFIGDIAGRVTDSFLSTGLPVLTRGFMRGFMRGFAYGETTGAFFIAVFAGATMLDGELFSGIFIAGAESCLLASCIFSMDGTLSMGTLPVVAAPPIIGPAEIEAASTVKTNFLVDSISLPFYYCYH